MVTTIPRENEPLATGAGGPRTFKALRACPDRRAPCYVTRVSRLLDECFAANRRWAAAAVESDPTFFRRLEALQSPDLLWIGCSDSRLPPNEIIGRAPGEVFVHRNVANVVEHTDVNCLSVLQYAVDVLKVKHVVVVGHYGCGGVRAAMTAQRLGLIDNWLRNIRDVHLWHRDELMAIPDLDARTDRLAELNVEHQVANICHTTILQDAWHRGQAVTVHGWIYALADGLLRDLGMVISSPDQIPPEYRLFG